MLNATNYSSDPLVRTYTWPDYQVANAGLMKFDLSVLPAGALVQEATLYLALVQSDTKSDATYTVSVHKVVGKNPRIEGATGYTADGITNWTPSTCCYQGLPLAQADLSPAYDQQSIGKTLGFQSWTVTAMVQEWLANPTTNAGLLLKADTSKLGDRYRYFASTEYPDASLRPFLRVTFGAADATPPSAALTAPLTGTTVSGTVMLTASASDNVGVASVRFRLDGALLGPQLATAPYFLNWNTTTVSDGNHTLDVVAQDWSGTSAASASIGVIVKNGALVLSPKDTWLGLDATNYSSDAFLRTHTWPDYKVANASLMTFDQSA